MEAEEGEGLGVGAGAEGCSVLAPILSGHMTSVLSVHFSCVRVGVHDRVHVHTHVSACMHTCVCMHVYMDVCS